ncbi:MAG: ABC transporter permease [Lachnospiraceae bacterium]|nr:ABC transporter permease [Lachnospiraceae bacterium]
MYAKLVFRNAKRSVKDYLVYIVTMTICVTLFYSFLSISSSNYNPDIGTEYDFTLLSDGMKVAICMITLLLLFLIRFVNHYMLRRKQKEFAVQSIMGMEQKTIGRIFFAETLIMGIVSILIGIFFGVFCSQFITAMLLTAYGKPYEISWTLFPDTVLLTVAFFVLCFFVVGIFNTRAIQKTKIIDMLSADKENEPELKKSRFISGVVVLFELFTVWGLIIGIQKVFFYYDTRFALPVQLMFWGNILFPLLTLLWSIFCIIRKKKRECFIAGLLICSAWNAFTAASVAALTNKYYLSLGGGTLNQYLLFVLIDLLFFICALIYLISGLIVAWKEKSPEHRYREEALFFLGQIISKLNTTSKTMVIICITLVLAIFMFVAAPILTGWSSGYLDIRSMYDVQVYSKYNDVYEEKNLPHDSYEIITDFLAEHKIDTDYDCTFNLYLPEKDDFHNRQKYDFPITAISLSDYNTIREMLGYEQIFLGEDEFTTQWKSIATEEEKSSFLAEHTSVATDGGTLNLSEQSCYGEAMGETIYNAYTNILYVFPDNICKKLLPVIKNRYITTTENISYENARKLERLFTEEYPEQTESGVMYGIRFSTLQTNSTIANNFVLQAAMLYGAVVLMIICLTVLSLQQLLDAGQYKYRFSVLRKLGVEEKHISKLILKQLSVWFGLPIIVAIVIATVVINYFIQTISAEISAYIGFSTLMLQIGTTVGILVILLICYFISTWIIFRRSVNS